ncbi:IS3 family transposase [Rhodococcus pyridinivorans]|uniref:IS3 family transposase n=1 Tax=Rhodococcus pyridinivorans TaxID=103816 RepID=UPI00368BAB16
MARKTYSEEFCRDAVDLYATTDGATVKQIASDLGITDATLSTWLKAAGVAVRGRTPKDPPEGSCGPESPAQELARLRREVADLKAAKDLLSTERDILRRAAKYFGRGDALVSRFQFVADNSAIFEVKRLCTAVEIKRSSYYAWKAGTPARAKRAASDAALAAKVRTIQDPKTGGDRAYGAPRVTHELNAGVPPEERVNHKRVARVMREHHLAGLRLRGKVRTTIPAPDDAVVPDQLNRDFTAKQINTRYVGDITYLPCGDGAGGTRFLYLATVIDLYSRRLVGWSIADHMRTSLVEDALNAAAHERGSLAGSVFHSDHGSVYCSADYARLCAELGVSRSMGRVGTSADNALAESFNATLKRETLAGEHTWPDTTTCRREVFKWILRYNNRRRHSACGYLSPTAYEHATAPSTTTSTTLAA